MILQYLRELSDKERGTYIYTYISYSRDGEPDNKKERQRRRPKRPASQRAKFLKRKKDRRPSEALNEEDKERKKKESLKTICSS